MRQEQMVEAIRWVASVLGGAFLGVAITLSFFPDNKVDIYEEIGRAMVEQTCGSDVECLKEFGVVK